MVADLLHVVEKVGGEEHRDVEGAEPCHQGQHLLAPERVEAGRGLIEQHQLGVADEGLRELGSLAHAGGEACDRTEARLVQPDEVEHVGGALARCPRRQAAQLTEGGHDVGRRLVERQAVVLWHEPEAAPHPNGIGGDVDPAHLKASRCGLAQTEHHPEQRGLARPVGTDEADPSPWHLDVEIVDGQHFGIPLGEADRAQQRVGWAHRRSLAAPEMARPQRRLWEKWRQVARNPLGLPQSRKSVGLACSADRRIIKWQLEP